MKTLEVINNHTQMRTFIPIDDIVQYCYNSLVDTNITYITYIDRSSYNQNFKTVVTNTPHETIVNAIHQ